MKKLLKALLASVGLTTLVNSPVAMSQDAIDLPSFDAAKADTANWREADPENLIMFKIISAEGAERGKVVIETADFAAPNHVAQFKKVVRSGDFNGTVFHRVIDDFMAQGGDVEMVKPGSGWPSINQEFVFPRKPFDDNDNVPKAQLLGERQSATDGYIRGFPIKTQSEFLASLKQDGQVESWIVHCAGVVSTARTSDPNSAGTQFFLMRETKHHLDKTYTAWGRVVSGQDVVMSIKKGDDAENGAVKRPDILVKAQMVADMPEDKRPRVLVQKTDGPDFAAILDANSNVDVCMLPPVPTILAD